MISLAVLPATMPLFLIVAVVLIVVREIWAFDKRRIERYRPNRKRRRKNGHHWNIVSRWRGTGDPAGEDSQKESKP